MKTHLSRIALILTFALVSILCAHAQSSGKKPHIIFLRLDDTIQPISDEYLTRGIKQAEVTQASAVLVELDRKSVV